MGGKYEWADRQTDDGPTRNVDGDEESGDARAYAGDVFGFRLWVLSSSEDIYMEHCVEREYRDRQKGVAVC